MYENVSKVKIKEEPMDCEDADLGVANQTNAQQDYLQDSGNFSSVTIKEEIIDDLDHQIVDESDDVITVNFGRGEMTDFSPTAEIVPPFAEECPRCFRSFNVEPMYRAHVYSCTMCPVCKRPAGHQYEQHMQAHRANRFFCEQLCGQHFASFVDVIEHEFREHRIRKAVCNMCSLKFTHPPDVRRHQAIVHSNLPQFSCSYCRSYYASADVLVAHWRRWEATCGMLMKLVAAASVTEQQEAAAAEEEEEVHVKAEPVDEDEPWSAAGVEVQVKTEIFEPGEYVETQLATGVPVEPKTPQFVLPPGLRIVKLPSGYKPTSQLTAVAKPVTLRAMPSANMVSIPRSALTPVNHPTQPRLRSGPVKIRLNANTEAPSSEPATQPMACAPKGRSRKPATVRKSAVAIKQIAGAANKPGATDPQYSVLTIPAIAPVAVEVHEAEFRRMVVESTMKALEDDSMTQASASGGDCGEGARPEGDDGDASHSADSPTPMDSCGEVPISLNALPKITYKGEVILSLKSLGGSSTVVAKDKLKDIVARAADLALSEARRKNALSRDHVQTLAKNAQKRKIVDQIVEEMKMAEMGVTMHDLYELRKTVKKKPPPPSLVQPINDTIVSLESQADGVELRGLNGEPPKSLQFPLATTSDRPLKALRREFSGYSFVWTCPQCSRHYEGKHSLRGHLQNYHRVDAEQLASMQVQVVSWPLQRGPTDSPTGRQKKKNKIEQAPEECTADESASSSCQDEEAAGHEPSKPDTLLSPEVAMSESGGENASPPDDDLNGRKRFQCTACGRVCCSKSMYLDHVRSNCSREPMYKCEVCSKGFFSASTLSCHRTIHTGVLPHKCDYCEKRFRTRGQVTVHHRIHTGERPFVCQVCSLSFTHRETLISHLARHIGMKRYKCYGCDKHFACISGLTMHRASRPDTCGKVKFSSRAVGPRVRVIRGQVVFEPQPEINPYLRGDNSAEVLSEIQNQPATTGGGTITTT